MPRDDALSGEFWDDLDALIVDPQMGDLFVQTVAERFLQLQEIEARRLLSAEYRRPREVRRRRSELRGEATHRAFARLCAEAGRERHTPLLQVTAQWSARGQVVRQLEALIATSRGSPTASGPAADPSDDDRSPRRRFWRRRTRRRRPTRTDWADPRSEHRHDRFSFYRVPWGYTLMSNLML